VARQDDDGTPGPRKSGGEPYSIALSQRAWAVWEYLRDAAVETFEASREQGLLAADAGPVAPLLPQRNGKPWRRRLSTRLCPGPPCGLASGAVPRPLPHPCPAPPPRHPPLPGDPTKIPAAAAALGVTVATFLEDYVGTTDEEVDLVSVRAMHALDQGALLLEFEQSDTMPPCAGR